MAELRRFLVNRKGNRVGVLVSNGRGSFGWSLCATTKGDKFNKEKALLIARGREATGFDVKKIPSSIVPEVSNFWERLNKYFKEIDDLLPNNVL
jgi:hypothetical protein